MPPPLCRATASVERSAALRVETRHEAGRRHCAVSVLAQVDDLVPVRVVVETDARPGVRYIVRAGRSASAPTDPATSLRYAAAVATGGIIFAAIMLLVLPIAIMFGGAIWSALMGWLLVDDAEHHSADTAE
jgi:hypothetical protein